MFIKENVNPKRKTSDCVIRAIAKVFNKDWIVVFDELVAIARRKFTIPSDKIVYEEYLKNYTTINVKTEDEGCRKRLTVADVCCMRGAYIVSIANHMTVVIDGNIYDLWDCSNSSAYKIWKIK